MKKKDILVTAILILCIAASLFLRHRDKEPPTPEEALQDVLARVNGLIELDGLPLEDAIKQVRGNGKLVLVSFEDPNCVHCIELDKKLNRLDDITLYTFLIPILTEDSAAKSRRIWCAPDPASAWNDWMLKRQMPSGAGDCDTSALDRNLELGEKIGILGVPYVFRAK
ncbi:MAG: DsbC family protein [Azoarcus sp.]|jgi:thiol:disulfide interchange protein DsbC|nr:DsbC family protein [Azoarcus sp.]